MTPDFIQAKDLHEERYIDPHYYPEFKAEDLTRREERTRSLFWSWYYWITDGIKYWNIYQEIPPPQIVAETPEEKLKKKILAEIEQSKKYFHKELKLRKELNNWHHLGQAVFEQNDYLEAAIQRLEEEVEELGQEIQKREFEKYKREMALERELADLQRKLNINVYLEIVSDVEEGCELPAYKSSTMIEDEE